MCYNPPPVSSESQADARPCDAGDAHGLCETRASTHYADARPPAHVGTTGTESHKQRTTTTKNK